MKWAVLVLFAALPLQWFTVPAPGPPERVHVLVMVLFTGLVFVRLRAATLTPVVTLFWPFILVNVALSVVWCGTAFYHGGSLLGPFQEIVLLVVFVAIGAVIHRACLVPESGILECARWAAAAATLSLLLAMWYSLSHNGVNPVSVFRDTVTTGNPQILEHDLFRTAFSGFGYDNTTARANMRHEVFGAVLVAMYLAMIATSLRPFRSSWTRLLYRGSLALGFVLILASLSRAVTLAALGIPLVAVARSLASGRLTVRQLGLGVVSALGVLVLAATGLLGLVWSRFSQDTSSYQARDVLLHQAVSNIGEHFLTGGVSTLGASSHDLVLDAWLRSGIFAAVLAAVVFVQVVAVWLALLARLPRMPGWLVPVTAAFALPVVRMLTAGGGVIPPGEWVCLAMIAGFLTFWVGQGRLPTSDDGNFARTAPVASGSS